MLRFVTGTAGTGKSTFITDTIVSLAQQGEKCLLLVPEQFSKTGEAVLFSALDKTRSNLVELFSFTSLLRDVQNNHTPFAATPITDAGKAVMARRALANVHNQLDMYSKQANNFGFSFNLAVTFDTLKRSGIDRRTFFELSAGAPAKNVKLKELSLIYSEYCGLMGDKFCDEEDLYTMLAARLPHDYTHNTHIFIDGFESFSHGQLQIISTMLSRAKDVTIALTCDSLYDTTKGTGNFSFVQNTAAQLIKTAKGNDISIASPVVMRDSVRFENSELKNVDMFLQGVDTEPVDYKHVFVTEFETQLDEVCFAVAKVHDLVKKGYTYNDIAIVCPQLEKYENQLQESFTLAKIPYFIDASRIISSSAPVILFKSVFDIMSQGLDSETVMPLLKTGLTCFDSDAIAMLENYLYVWRDYDFDFSQPFELSPSGLKPAPEEDELENLAQIDNIRHTLYGVFEKYRSTNMPKSGDMLRWCYEIVTELGCDEKLAQAVQDITAEEDKQLLVRQWDTAISCLDDLYSIIGEDVIRPREVRTLFMLMVEGVKIGFAPQTQDCVMITDPKRMKLDSVQAVLLLGAAQDIFPAIVSEGGLITTADRRYLKENNYPLKNDFENLFSFENLYYYKALTSPREYLFISNCKKNIDSRQLLSAQVELLKSRLNLPSAEITLEDYAVTKEFFTDYISGQATNSNRHSFVQLLGDIDVPVSGIGEKDFNIKDLALLEKLLGDTITISPTGAQNYFQCAFMYFLQRILKIKPLEKAEFSARLAGDYLHFIAQRVMEKYGESYYNAPWEKIEQDVDRAVKKFIAENYPPQIYNDTKFTAQHENMRQNAVQLLQYIHTEQADSLFRPVAFEQTIGLGGSVPPLKIPADNGKKVNIVGVADRVDIYRGAESDYLRIIDYKTGTQKFSLDDVYNGLSSQLLLYMNALLEAGFGRQDKEMKAGAVVYQPADARFKFDKDDEKLYTAVGMALSNPEISEAFDTRQSGRYGLISGDDKLRAVKGSEIAGEKKFRIVLDYVKQEIANMANGVYSGRFDALPLETGEDRKACNWCRFKSVCQNSDKKRPMIKNEFAKMEKEDD